VQTSATDAAILRVGGLVPLSTTDFPGRLAAVVFCQGCPWRCSYCHNPHLLPRHGAQELQWQTIVAFLQRRRGLLDAVVFSGGEPTLQPGLAAAMRDVKAMGYEIGLHTAGIDPSRLREVLPLVDWVGLDIKTVFDDYAGVTAAPHSGRRARQSLSALLQSGVAHEVRTTVDPQLLPASRLRSLATELAGCGVRHYVLQEYRAQNHQSATLQDGASYLNEKFSRSIAPLFATFEIRRA
jgi:pyruvate formate lyase activating enzyme